MGIPILLWLKTKILGHFRLLAQNIVNFNKA